MTRAILEEIDANAEELVEFAADLIRIPTVNPPGTDYERCAKIIGDRMSALGYEVEYVEALDRPEHTDEHPRVNVVGTLRSDDTGPCIHLNGHFDVVPAESNLPLRRASATKSRMSYPFFLPLGHRSI